MVMMMIQVIVGDRDRGTTCDADNFEGDGDYRGHSPRTSAMGHVRRSQRRRR